MEAREVQELLRAEVGPAMESWGFEAATSGTFCYRKRLTPSGHLFVVAQVGPHTMNWFRIELRVGPTNLISQAKTWVDSYGRYLLEADKQRLLDLANPIRRQSGLLKERASWVGDDLPFRRPEHVVAYARAFRVMLPRIINGYIKQHNLPLDPLPE